MNTEVTKRVIPNLCGTIKVIPRTDTTLSKEGFSADAKVVGDKFAEHKLRIDNIDPHFAKNVGFDGTNSGLNATNVQSAIECINDELKIPPKEGLYYGFSIYFANKTAGLFVPLDSYILEHYTIAAADNILFSGIVEGYTVDEVTVKNNGVFVGHTFATTGEALSAMKATSGVNGTTRLTFTAK